jgi:hypothetical protein
MTRKHTSHNTQVTHLQTGDLFQGCYDSVEARESSDRFADISRTQGRRNPEVSQTQRGLELGDYGYTNTYTHLTTATHKHTFTRTGLLRLHKHVHLNLVTKATHKHIYT